MIQTNNKGCPCDCPHLEHDGDTQDVCFAEEGECQKEVPFEMYDPPCANPWCRFAEWGEDGRVEDCKRMKWGEKCVVNDPEYPTRHFAALVPDRIGHFAMNTELFVQEVKAGLREAPDCYTFNERMISNVQLAEMWRRVIPVSFDQPMFPDTVENLYSVGFDNDTNHILWDTEPLLSFTEREEVVGANMLRAMGVEGKFVCLHMRDKAYGVAMGECDGEGYHDYRNVNSDDYIEAAEALADRGYWVLRMGAKVERRFAPEHPRIIDYASFHRTPFMDIYLAGKCHFMWSTASGLDAVSAIFRRPILFTDVLPVGHDMEWGPKNKLYYKHVLKNGVEVENPPKFWSTREYMDNGYEIANMSSHGLTQAVLKFEEENR